MTQEAALWSQWRRLVRQDEPDPLEVVQLASSLGQYFDAVKAEAVQAAREAGRSWETIARSVGTSRQSVWERYRRADRVRSSRSDSHIWRTF